MLVPPQISASENNIKLVTDNFQEWTKVTRRKGAQKNTRNNDIKNYQNVKETTKLTTEEKVKASRTTIIGDSIIKFIRGDKLSRKHNGKCMSFPGATIEALNDFIKPILKRNPKKVIVHLGTNNIKKDKPKQVKQKLVKLVTRLMVLQWVLL